VVSLGVTVKNLEQSISIRQKIILYEYIMPESTNLENGRKCDFIMDYVYCIFWSLYWFC